MRARVSIAGSVFAAFAVLACVTDVEPPPSDIVKAKGKVVVVLPDTQFYACAYPDIFERQTAWIAEQRAAREIAFVVHTGDVVDEDADAQWKVAADSFSRLDGEVPYLVTTGNHDLSPDRQSLFARFLGTRGLDEFEHSGAYEPGRSENSYAIVRLDGRDWLVLGLEFGPRDRAVAWADGVLSEHAELPAIVFTHAYLYNDGFRYDRRRDPHQPYHPDDYAQTPAQGVNDGEDLWTKLIARHENVRLVLSGHVIPDGTARSMERRRSGRPVHQVLANYQWCDRCPCADQEGGGGYLRILEFSSETITVSTYSPYLDDWLRDDDNQFDLALD